MDEHNRNRIMRGWKSYTRAIPATAKSQPALPGAETGRHLAARSVLCDRIDERLKRRMADGMLARGQGPVGQGVSPAFLRKLGLEYRYLSAYLLGEIETEAEMLHELSRAIKRFAKRQMTWFKRDQKRIRWLDMQSRPVCGGLR